MPTRVATAARLHFGFLNLSLARGRLYGGLGVGVDRPSTVVRVSAAETVDAPEGAPAEYARLAVDHLEVPGAAVELESAIPRHVGLGSGTQLALAVYAGIAREYDRPVDPREAAPALDRGGRSGVGVATFADGGFVVDAGHPAERFTTDRPPRGRWRVPGVLTRHELPTAWRFVLAVPDAPAGRSGEEEDRSMRAAVRSADPAVADEIDTLVLQSLLPAVVEEDPREFGRAIAEIGRLNGVWYAGEQGGVFRPPTGAVVDQLADSPAVHGAGQTSWGPTVYGVTHESRATAAESAARDALADADLDGEVLVVAPRNEGASVSPDPA